MKSTRNIVVGIAAVASLGIAAAAYAIDGPGPGCGSGPGMGPMGGLHGPHAMHGARGPGGNFDPAALIDARMAYVKSALKITTGQEAVWNAYSDKVKQQAEAMKAARATAAQAAALPAPERLTQQLALMQQHLDSMKSLVSTEMKNLYDVLTPEQKAVADKVLGKPRRGFGRPGA